MREFPGGPVVRRASLVSQMVKNWLAVQETWVPSLGQEDPLEKGRRVWLRAPTAGVLVSTSGL